MATRSQSHRGTSQTCPTYADRRLQQSYAGFFASDFHWTWFVTLTFSQDLSIAEANDRLHAFLRRIEETTRSPVSCLIVLEQKRYGGGVGDDRPHFHLLMNSTEAVTASYLTTTWAWNRFGGELTSGPSAKVIAYDPDRWAALYVVKTLNSSTWDPELWRLHLNCKRAPKSSANSSKVRSSRKRDDARGRGVQSAS